MKVLNFFSSAAIFILPPAEIFIASGAAGEGFFLSPAAGADSDNAF